ncbi:MAG TPA: DUF1697 domain-containing protein [Bacteroidales bacterium]|nr:DUF1697 domain-containing protein [Bacteroidales bacterium]
MQTLIAILRGINVGGHKKVPMKELKELIELLGFRDVTTYIQSGNVVFSSPEILPAEFISEKIGMAVGQKFGFDVPVICRTKDEWNETISSNPFIREPEFDTAFLHVTFLEKAPADDVIKSFTRLDFPPEQFFISGKEVFLFCPYGYGNAKLTNTFIESSLGVKATTRNWKTVLALAELADRN